MCIQIERGYVYLVDEGNQNQSKDWIKSITEDEGNEG